MQNPSSDFVLPRWLRSWEEFWFTPADPTVLGLMRATCGMIVVYTLFAYTFNLQDQMGEHAWNDLSFRMGIVRDRPQVLATPEMARLPEPDSEEQAKELNDFRQQYGFDMRVYGLRPPRTDAEREFLKEFMDVSPEPKQPPQGYPRDAREAKEILEYVAQNGVDPRRLYARGEATWSIWFHVTDPKAMMILHVIFIGIAVLFTLGFCTRITAALTWFSCLCYVNRNPTMLFGADTMMLILLLYLMIGPSGAVFSLDRLISVWWTMAKPRWVRWWHGLPAEPVDQTPTVAPNVEPSISANVAIRVLQIHLSIIYLIAGLAKLQGPAWWTGRALWMTIANYEFAPMTESWYMDFLRFLATHPTLLAFFLTFGGLFTLAFEISYIFLIWRPRWRWVFLGSACLLHGGIGLFMGLKTFSMLMLVMNMAFLRPEEAAWILSFFALPTKVSAVPPPAPAPPEAPVPSTGIKVKA